MNSSYKEMNNCYLFDISTNTVIRKENMNEARVCHGLLKMAQRIFAFGGYHLKSAEVYDGVQNSWKNLPHMLQEGGCITCVRV